MALIVFWITFYVVFLGGLAILGLLILLVAFLESLRNLKQLQHLQHLLASIASPSISQHLQHLLASIGGSDSGPQKSAYGLRTLDNRDLDEMGLVSS